MNIFTPIRTETRLDYYGNPYEAIVIGNRQRDLSELWEQFKKQQIPERNDQGQYHGGGNYIKQMDTQQIRMEQEGGL